VPDATLLLEPSPRRMLPYRSTQLQRQQFLFVSRASVGALEHHWSANRSTTRDLSQQMVDVATSLAAARERSPLQKRAHTLAVSDARSLRLLEKLIEESQLTYRVRLVRLSGEVFE
jgi:hypothetical protein